MLALCLSVFYLYNLHPSKLGIAPLPADQETPLFVDHYPREVMKHVKCLAFTMWQSHAPGPGCLAPLLSLSPLFSAALSQQVAGCLVNNLLPPTVMWCSGKIAGVESQGGLVVLFCLKCVTSACLSHFICKMGINTLKEYRESCCMRKHT